MAATHWSCVAKPIEHLPRSDLPFRVQQCCGLLCLNVNVCGMDSACVLYSMEHFRFNRFPFRNSQNSMCYLMFGFCFFFLLFLFLIFLFVRFFVCCDFYWRRNADSILKYSLNLTCMSWFWQVWLVLGYTGFGGCYKSTGHFCSRAPWGNNCLCLWRSRSDLLSHRCCSTAWFLKDRISSHTYLSQLRWCGGYLWTLNSL